MLGGLDYHSIAIAVKRAISSIGVVLNGIESSSYFTLSGVITPAQIVANTNDYAPLGIATAQVLRISSDARRTITGVLAQPAGRVLLLQNVGTFPIPLKYQDVGSSVSNRFFFACTLGGGQCIEITYDGVAGGWRAKQMPEPIGKVVDFGMSTMPEGYLAIDQDVSRTTYAALFNEWGTTWGPGDGSTTFGLWVGKGRGRIAAGTGTIAETVAFGSVSTGSDNWTVPANNKKWNTGQAVQLTTTSGLPAPLALATTYYLVRASSTLIQFATTLANAQNGTVIDITTQGTGNHTVTGTLTARTVGEIGGEEDHPMTISELLAHIHGTTESPHFHAGGWAAGGGGATSGSGTQSSNTGTATTGLTINSVGGNTPMNNMQPYAVVNVGVKYC